MFRSVSTGLGARVAVQQGPKNPLYASSTRGMATEKQLKVRMKSIANIKKITGAMKMVASAKLRRSEAKLTVARAFTAPLQKLWPAIPKDKMDAELEALGDYNKIVVPIACDRGLCGAMNSSVIRNIKHKATDYKEKEKSYGVITFGEKARQGLERVLGPVMVGSVSESGKNVELNYKQVCELTDFLMNREFDQLEIVSNRYRNAIAFDTNTDHYYSLALNEKVNPTGFLDYDLIGDDLEFTDNFYNFRMSVLLWGYFQEADTVELSARVQAMANSSSSAGDILEKITLQYNTMRQAKITTELIEIISGASAAAAQQAAK